MFSQKEYHTPDERWEIFGKPDFETYSKDYVVKGLFHSDVPKDVVEAYRIAEYIQAHAYYHYPLYDEAASKMLRIVEMAVKFRCTQMSIPLEFEAKNKKSKEMELKPYPLKTLMDSLITKEPHKNLDWEFENLRHLRNSYMHPQSHSYMGGSAYFFIERTVIFFNKLFSRQDIFEVINQKILETKNALHLFDSNVFILSFRDKRFLVENVKIDAALLVNNEWIYCLTCFPILKNTAHYLKEHVSSNPHSFFVRSFEISEERVSTIQLETDEIITISTTDHEKNIEMYSQFVKDKENASEIDRNIYELSCNHNVAKNVNTFLYQWLYKSI